MRAALLAFVVLLVGCGQAVHRASVRRVEISPWPEGPTLVASTDTVVGKKLLARIDFAIPARLPANRSEQECRLGTTVIIVADKRHRYGPCQWPDTIERLRRALVEAAAHRNEVKAPTREVVSAEWKAVFDDWYDGRMDHWHSCAAVREALRHIPTDGPVYSTLGLDLEAYARGVC